MIKIYGVLGTSRLIFSLLYTKILFSNSRLIRMPFDIRNRRFIDLGKNLTTGFGCRLEAFITNNKAPNLSFGKNIQINDYVHIACGESIIIRNNVLIASKVFITDINHGSYSLEYSDSPSIPPRDRSLSTRPVVIDENVWLGENVCVMPGVTIGVGCIVGAGSIVTKSIPAYSIAVGNPAKVIKTYNQKLKIWQPVA